MTRFQMLRRFAESRRSVSWHWWRLVTSPIHNAAWHLKNRDISRYIREFRRNLERHGKWTIQA